MKKIYILIWVIVVFLIWRNSFALQVMFEKQFNTLRVCNNTLYNLDSISVRWTFNHFNYVGFHNIKSGECSDYEKSYLLDSWTKKRISFMYDSKRYFIDTIPTDLVWFNHKSFGHYTLYLNNIDIEKKLFYLIPHWVTSTIVKDN